MCASRICMLLLVIFPAPRHGIAEVVSVDAQAWRHVEKWLVEAESRSLPVVDGESDRPLRVNLSRRIMIATSDNQLRYFVGHPDERLGIDWKNEPFNLDTRIRDEQLIKYYPFNRVVEFADFQSGAVVPDPVARDVLLFFFPRWPLRNYPAPQIEQLGMILVIGEAVESDQYEVTSERQKIGQEWCRLVRSKSGMDRIWISEEKELCVMRRQWYVDRTRTTRGELATKDVSEVAPGLWLPTVVELTYHSDSHGTDQVVARRETRIIRCEIDRDVSPKALDLTLPVGTIERTSDDEIKQLVPGGTEHLMKIATFYRDRIGLPEQSQAADVSTKTLLQTIVGTLTGCFVGIVLLRALGFGRKLVVRCKCN